MALLAGCTASGARRAYWIALAADAGTTYAGTRKGGTELNPILKANPTVGVLALGGVYGLVAELLLRTRPALGTAMYQAGAALHGGAAAWNGAQVAK